MSKTADASPRTRWSRFRFSVIGHLLAAPPEAGDLQDELAKLAARSWKHPTTGAPTQFGVSTIERWLYTARNAPEPVEALARRVDKRVGTHPSIAPALEAVIRAQHKAHTTWTTQLHYDNFVIVVKKDTEKKLGTLPSYSTVRRFMREKGLSRLRRVNSKRLKREADPTFVAKEARSFENPYVNGLWHLDFHQGSRRVRTSKGEWSTVDLFGMLDDYSRYCPHLQWYYTESARTLTHGLQQGILKKDRPGMLLTDNGGAMLAAETTEGLERLSITHETTLPYTPEQNAKQEFFWSVVEGRLMPMLEREKDLTLESLNRATQAWIEYDYNHKYHSEIGMTPYERYSTGTKVGLPAPSPEELRAAFRCQETRTQRKSDGTITVQSVRFEVPNRYRTIRTLTIRYASWDLTSVDLIDAKTDKVLIALYPVDKAKNASGRRAALQPVEETVTAPVVDEQEGMAPLLKDMLARYAATGMPPAYIPLDDGEEVQP